MKFTPEADLARHLRELKAKLPARGFTIVVQPPFVIVGDEDAQTVRLRATNTVRWAVERLKRDFFRRDPEHLLTIYLFKDAASYERHARELFGQRPETPFGYYSPARRALVMNIATGGGTLVHEIVHPFLEANFPDCPPWFNEGLGSLYEQSGDRSGHIVGHTNWRLPGLQRAIRRGDVPPFPTLLARNADAFYNRDDTGTNYAQARYLCYYLQERGLLVRFYREFSARRKADPTGLATLKKVLGERDMTAFQKRWEAWVLQLTFPS